MGVRIMTGYLIGAAVIVVLLVFWEIWREIHRFIITEYEIESPKFEVNMEEKRIVFLSDLHNREYGEKNEELVGAIRAAKPDLILVTGDMLVGKPGHSFEKAARFMRQLPGIAPVYYSNGNHEQRMREEKETYGDAYWQYKKELEEAGVIWLENEGCSVECKGGKVQIYGLEIPIESYYRMKRYRPTVEDILERLGQPDMGEYNILLAHHPEFADAYKKWGADLILSGHLHGGVARLPVLGGIISPQAGLFPKYSGDCYREGDCSIVVSKGLGTHTLNIRFWNPAEMIILHVRGKENNTENSL